MPAVRWAVATTHPQGEAMAARHLARTGFEFFLPKTKSIHSRCGRKFERQEALFPGYLFVVVGDAWNKLLTTIGIVGVISQAGIPAMVGDQTVTGVKAMCDRDGFLLPAKMRPQFVCDQSVRIKSGLFVNNLAKFEMMLPKDRAAVFISLLGQSVRVELAKGDLIAA